MKKLIILCALFIVGNSAIAQDMAAAQARADQKTNSMISSLSLNAEQAEKVKTLNLGLEQKYEAINANASFTAEQKAEQIQLNKDGEKTALRGILNDTQYAQFENSEKTPAPAQMQRTSKANINTSRSTIKEQ